MTWHLCPGGCGEQVRAGRLACRADWYRLPKDLRDEIWRTWQEIAVSGHRDAILDALAWYRNNPRVTRG